MSNPAILTLKFFNSPSDSCGPVVACEHIEPVIQWMCTVNTQSMSLLRNKYQCKSNQTYTLYINAITHFTLKQNAHCSCHWMNTTTLICTFYIAKQKLFKPMKLKAPAERQIKGRKTCNKKQTNDKSKQETHQINQALELVINFRGIWKKSCCANYLEGCSKVFFCNFFYSFSSALQIWFCF